MKLSHDSITHSLISHIVPCINSSKLLIISVTSIKHKVVYMNFNDDSPILIANFPNFVESD